MASSPPNKSRTVCQSPHRTPTSAGCHRDGSTSRSVTHPRTTPSQARLTWEFCSNGLPKKKEFLIDMSSLSSLISQAITYTTTQRNRRPCRAPGASPLGTKVCASSIVHVPSRVPRRVTNAMNNMTAHLSANIRVTARVGSDAELVTPQTHPPAVVTPGGI